MNKINKFLTAVILSLAVAVIFLSDYVFAQEGWFKPFVELRETYDDNIYLTETEETTDWITTLSPGFIIQPRLTKHKLTLSYRADLNFFANHGDEDNDNHTADADLELLFNKFRIALNNRFRYFSDRSGGEDVARVPRTQDHATIRQIFDLNKLDLSLGYYYRFEDYRSENSIGNFGGQALTYQDLDRDEHTFEVESAFKFWPKTSLLLSGDYGFIEHDTGNKPDSDYFNVLTGLRGEPTAKMTVEGKVGYRSQDYEDDSKDFDSLVFYGSLVENFTPRDVLRLDFLRTTNDTIYKENAYYKITFIGAGFKHAFTDRFSGKLNVSYQRDSYPTETTEVTQVEKRDDDLWIYNITLFYELPVGYTVDLKYEYRSRDSEFARFDYENNLVSIGLNAEF